MGKKKNKVRFELQENETIDECLNRMKQESYVPVGKYEKPIFKEVIKEDGKVAYEPIRQQIVLEGKLMNDK